jgi:hypothetical protein
MVEHPRPLPRHSFRRDVVNGRLFVLLAITVERVLNPRRTARNLAARLNRTPWPSIAKMSEAQFAAYARRTGIEAQLAKTLSKSGGRLEDQVGADGRLQAPTGESKP